MANTDLYNAKNEKVGEVELPAGLFGGRISPALLHEVSSISAANERAGTRAHKTRGAVSGGGRKPWKQKGTGRARQGSTRAPQWVGGGRVHTPQPRDYAAQMPRKMRQAALRSALSVKAKENSIVVLDELKLAEPKTKLMAQALTRLVGESSALILIPAQSAEYDVVVRSANNIPDAKTLFTNYLNIRDLLGFDKVIIPVAALDVVTNHLG